MTTEIPEHVLGFPFPGYDYVYARHGALAYRKGLTLSYGDRWSEGPSRQSWRYGWMQMQQAVEGGGQPVVKARINWPLVFWLAVLFTLNCTFWLWLGAFLWGCWS